VLLLGRVAGKAARSSTSIVSGSALPAPCPVRFIFTRRSAPCEAIPVDVYPIRHKNLIFNLITDYDLSFKEVRAILDDLLDKGVFKEQKEAEAGKFFDLEIENIHYVIDVNGYEVVVYRRTELS